MATVRKPFQGVWNIIRFNWHFYVFAFLIVFILAFTRSYLPPSLFWVATAAAFSATLVLLVSLIASTYIYDFSGLYKMDWLNDQYLPQQAMLVNIHAGFDETSVLISEKYPGATLRVFDFYDPVKHTEVSIKRARKAYPAYPGTVSIRTSHLPLQAQSCDGIFVILSAHEIRDETERILFFKQLALLLKPKGCIIVTEHLRDTANFLVYTVGFFHFFSRATWHRTFRAAGLQISSEVKINPFITTFTLVKNGNTY